MVDIDSMNIDELEQLRDACNRRILEMRQTKGLSLPALLRLLEEVKTALQDQGKEWHSLERWQWMDGEVRFWLNPSDQENYRPGWFSIDELIAWSHDRGPIMAQLDEDEFDDLIDDEPAYGDVAWPRVAGRPVDWRSGGVDGAFSTSNEALIQIL